MPTYLCDLCNFSTHLKSNYTSHLSSKKHGMMNKVKLLTDPSQPKVNPESPQSQPRVTPKSTETIEKVAHEFTCKYCEQQFKFKQSMYRHIKYTCTKNKDEDLKELVRLYIGTTRQLFMH